MRALSIRQPWASLICSAEKPTENRTWRTTHRGPLIVHASRGYDHGAREIIRGRLGLDDAAMNRLVPSPGEALTGYLGVVEVVGCHYAGAASCGAHSDWFPACNGWADPDRWHWQLDNPVRFLEPIPGPGRLGLFAPPADVVDVARWLGLPL